MKKLLHKWLAMTLACVMALSCVTFAAAAAGPAPYQPPDDYYEPYTDDSNDGNSAMSFVDGVGNVNPVVTGTEVTTSSGGNIAGELTQEVETKYASGGTKGISRSEGPLPADPIRLELPTVGVRTLDMILDPHKLIQATNAARYSNEDGYKATFSGDALYFLNSVTSGDTAFEYGYTDTTQNLTITNKSNLPVGVDLTLRVDKGLISGDTFDFDFVDDKDSLSTASGDTLAQMYLSLQTINSGGAVDIQKAVKKYGSTDDDKVKPLPTATVHSGDDLVGIIGATTPDTPYDIANSQYKDKVTFQWAKVSSGDSFGEIAMSEKEAFLTALGGSGNTITVTDGDTEAATTSGDKLTVDVQALTGYKSEATPKTITNAARDVNVSVRYYKEANSVQTDIAFVYFVIKANELPTGTSGKIVRITVAKSADPDEPTTDMGYAAIRTTLAKPVDAYVKGYDATNETGYYWAFVESTSSGDLTLWEQQDLIGFKPDYPSVTFNITGAINGVPEGVKKSAWDGHGDKIKLNLIWDVFAVDDDAEVGGGGGNSVTGTPPTVTATTKPSGTGTSVRKLVLTWTNGTDDYADYAPSTTLVLSNDSSLTMTKAINNTGGTLTNTNAYNTIGNINTTGTVTFTSASTGATYDVTVSPLMR